MTTARATIDGLYHRVLGFPAVVKSLFSRVFNLQFSGHARRAMLDDRYGNISAPGQVQVTSDNLIEVEVAGGAPSKFVVRIPHDEKCDMVLVVIPEGPERGFVKTVWLNEKSDQHHTLKRHLYRKP